MPHRIPRIDQHCEKIDSFIQSDKDELFLTLYPNEIKRLGNLYPSLILTEIEEVKRNQFGRMIRVSVSKS